MDDLAKAREKRRAREAKSDERPFFDGLGIGSLISDSGGGAIDAPLARAIMALHHRIEKRLFASPILDQYGRPIEREP